MKRPSVHWCRVDKDCRSYGAPNRISIRTTRYYFAAALNRDSRFAGKLHERPKWFAFHKMAF